MLNKLSEMEKPVALFAKSKDNIWTDPYLAQQMLAAHLSEHSEGATRNWKFVKASTAWLAETFPPLQYPEVLDLGCGPGIYGTALFQEGYQVTGLDFSSNSIAYAKHRAAVEGVAVKYAVADYLQADLGQQQYDLILLIYCDLGVLAPWERQQLLQKVWQALKVGGRLVFDVFTHKHGQAFQEGRSWELAQNNFWSEKPCLHLEKKLRYPGTATCLEQHWLVGEDSYKEFYIWETTFAPEELQKELQDAGFHTSEWFADVTGRCWQTDSETVCFAAVKES